MRSTSEVRVKWLAPISYFRNPFTGTNASATGSMPKPRISSVVDPIDTCHPLGVEVYQPDRGILEGWQSPATADYRGIHGLDRP